MWPLTTNWTSVSSTLDCSKKPYWWSTAATDFSQKRGLLMGVWAFPKPENPRTGSEREKLLMSKWLTWWWSRRWVFKQSRIGSITIPPYLELSCSVQLWNPNWKLSNLFIHETSFLGRKKTDQRCFASRSKGSQMATKSRRIASVSRTRNCLTKRFRSESLWKALELTQSYLDILTLWCLAAKTRNHAFQTGRFTS